MSYYRDEKEIDVLGADTRTDGEAIADEIDDRNRLAAARDVAEIEEETALVVRDARAIEITDQVSYDHAGAFLVDGIKAGLRRIADLFDPIDNAQKEARRVTIEQRRTLEGPLLEAEEIIKLSIGDYDIEQQRLAAAAQAEQIRVAREEADARKLEEAAALETAGHQAAAEEKLAAPSVPVVVAPTQSPARPKGISVRTKPDFRILDEKAIRRAYLKPDAVKIRKIVTAHGADAAAIVGGIEIFQIPVVSARAR